MKKRIFGISICIILLLITVVLTACANETDALLEQINTLENEKVELQSTISVLQSDLDTSQRNYFRTLNELQDLIASIEAADAADEQPAQPAFRDGPLEITYKGVPNKDMSWEYRSGLELGLNVDYSVIDEDAEIVWVSTKEDIFTVEAGEDGLTAVVTPKVVGSAELVVTVDGFETRSWVRIT